MEEFKGKSNQELKEELNNLNEMQEFLKDEIDDEDMKKEYDDNQEKIDYLTKVVSDEPISVPEPSSEPQMDETILVSEKEMGKPKDIKVPEIPKDLFFADGGITKKYFVPRYVKDKISPNFLNVYIDYPTPSGVQVAYGKETMSGQQRRLGSEKAMKLAKEIVEDKKNKYGENLEDIDYFDNERGKVTIFAVSDDFEDTNFALGGYLTSAGIGAYYGAKNSKSVKKVTDPIDKAISQIGKNLTDKKFAKGGVLSSDEKKKIEEHISYIHQEDIDVEHLPTNKEYVEGIIEEKIVDKSKREAVEKYISDRDKSRKEYVDYWKEEDFAKGGSVVSPSGIVYVVRGRDKKGFVIAEEIAYSTKDAEKKSIKMTLEDKGNKIVDIKTEIFKPKKYAKGGEIKVGDYVSVNAGYGMKHIGKVNSKHHMHNDRVYVDGIGDALEIKRLTKVKPPSMADGGKIDEKRERVIDYFINNEEEEELISRMGGNGEEFLEDRDGNYDEIYERINDNYNNEDIDELFNEYLGYAKGGEIDLTKEYYNVVAMNDNYEDLGYNSISTMGSQSKAIEKAKEWFSKGLEPIPNTTKRRKVGVVEVTRIRLYGNRFQDKNMIYRFPKKLTDLIYRVNETYPLGERVVEKPIEENYAKGGALSKEFKFDKNFVIYVPSTTNVGNKISKKDKFGKKSPG